MADDFPLIMTAAGAQPTPPATIRQTLINGVAAIDPGYTANLPGSLVEDIVSTDTGAIVLCDQARVELVNSLTPYGSNEFLLTQLGNVYGVAPGAASNTSAYLVFTGTPGFIISQGFTVSDGTHQYVVQDGGIIPTSTTSDPIYCVATDSGTWPVPANSITTLVTSVPMAYPVSVTNPLPGTPAQGVESPESYRARVLQAGLAPAQGMGSYLKTLLGNLPGVQPRLVSVRQGVGGWEVLCGGGDPYQIANAIYTALFDISSLVPSVLQISGVSKANPAVVTTALNHELTTGQNNVYITGATGMTVINGGPYTVTVISPTTFSIPIDTSAQPTYTGNGVVTPNARNVTANIIDYPDTYTIPFVNPPPQPVVIDLTWNSTSPFLVSPTAVAQLGNAALVNYVNSIPVGAPMNLFELQAAFQLAVASLIPVAQLTRMIFTVTISGVLTSPETGTGVIAGDPESYLLTSAPQITITQG